MARRIVAGSGWKTVGLGVSAVCRAGVDMSSSIVCDSAFPWQSVRDPVPIVPSVAAGVAGLAPWSRGPPPSPSRRRRRPPQHHDHRRLLLPVVPARAVGRHRARRCRAACGSTSSPLADASWSSASDRVELQSGDLALVPHGTGHRIEAGGPTEYPSIPDLPHDEQSDNYAVLRYGNDGPLTELVCGGLRLEHPSARRLLDGLPAVVHLRTVRRTVLGATLDLLADEVASREVGSEAVISRLCDILVIQAIRHWMTSDDATGSAVAPGDERSTDRPGSRRPARRTGHAMDDRIVGVAGGDVTFGVRRSLPRSARSAGDGLPDRAPHSARDRPSPPQRPNRCRSRHRRRLRVRRFLQPRVQASPRNLTPPATSSHLSHTDETGMQSRSGRTSTIATHCSNRAADGTLAGSQPRVDERARGSHVRWVTPGRPQLSTRPPRPGRRDAPCSAGWGRARC